MRQNLFSRARIDGDLLSEISPKVGAVVARMLLNGQSFKKARNYVRANVVDAAIKGVIKKPKPVLKPKVVKRGQSSVDKGARSIKNAANRAAKLQFKMPPIEKIEARYSKLLGSIKRPTHDAIYSSILFVSHMIRHIFSAAEFKRSAANQPDIEMGAIFNKWDDPIYREVLDDPDTFIKVQPDHILTRVAPIKDHGFRIRIANPDSEPEIMEATRRCGRIIQTLFHDYSLPSHLMKVDASEMDEAEKVLLGIPTYTKGPTVIVKGDTKRRKKLTLRQVCNLRPVYSHYDVKSWAGGPDNISLPSDKEFGRRIPQSVRDLLLDMIEFEFELEPTPFASAPIYGTSSAKRNFVKDEKTGNETLSISETNDVVLIGYTLRMSAYIKWPLDLAYYATFCTKPDEFIPAFFFRYVALNRQYSSRQSNWTGGFKPPARINPVHKIKETVEQEQKTRTLVPRTNSDGFVIVGPSETGLSGYVLKIPQQKNDNVDAYTKMYRDAYDDDLGEVKFSKENAVQNCPIFVDWANSMFTYANSVSDGNYLKHGVSTVNLTGAVPLDDVTIGRDLSRKLYMDGIAVSRFIKGMDNFLKEKGLGDSKMLTLSEAAAVASEQTPQLVYSGDSIVPAMVHYGNHKELFDLENKKHSRMFVADALKDMDEDTALTLSRNRIYSFSDAWKALEVSNYLYEATWASISNPNSLLGSDGSESENQEGKVAKAALQFMLFHCKRAARSINEWGIAYSEKLIFMEYRLALITKYGINSGKYLKALETAINANNTDNIDYNKPVEVINLPKLKTLLPHTVKAVAGLHKPGNTTAGVSIQAGGAKTITSILDIMKALKRGVVQHAVVIPPTGLTATWVDEINSKSSGSINAIPLTTAILRDMERTYSNLHPGASIDIPDYKNLGRFLLSCPKNTIFIVSMEFLKIHSEVVVYGDQTTTRYYMAEFLRDLFDAPNKLLTCIDESHFVKRIGTARTTAVSVLHTAAKIKRIMSGTMIFDRLDDIVGQMALNNPAALGNNRQFDYRYKEPKGSVFRDDAQERMLEDMRPFIMNIRAKRRDWAFILPTLIESFHSVRLTENQQIFYDKMIRKALDEIAADTNLMKELAKESKDNEKKILKSLDLHLSKLESFIYAPDAHILAKKNPYLQTDDTKESFAFQFAFEKLPNITPEDMISPKVKKADEIITKHLYGYTEADGSRVDPKPSKVMVFSQRKVNSMHFYEHTKHKKETIHYRAGDIAALTRFLNDDRIKVLSADETSINTGRNLQLAGRIIRMETLWTPGGQEQAVARIWRPDFDDLTLERRPFVNMDWIYTIPSFEALKIARFISKYTNMKRLDEIDNPAFFKDPIGELPDKIKKLIRDSGIYVDYNATLNSQLSNMKELKLSFTNLQKFKTPDDVKEYFGYYALFSSWENREFDKAKSNPKNRLSVIAPTQRADLEGSKKLAFVPRVPGQKPLDPENKYDFQPVAILQAHAEMDAEETADGDEGLEEYLLEETNPVKHGDVVDTQWGFGFVVKVTKNTLSVSIPGFKEPVSRINKACAYVIGNEKARSRIRMKLKKNLLSPRFPTGVDGSIALGKTSRTFNFDDKIEVPRFNPSKPINDLEDDETEVFTRFGRDKVNITDNDLKLELTPMIIDKQAALVAYDADSDADILETNFGFRRVHEFVAVRVKTPIALDKVLRKLQGSFKIHEKYIRGLEGYKTAMLRKNLMSFDPHGYKDAFRFFSIEQHKRIKEGVLRPYPVVWAGQLFLCFDRETQPSARRIKAKLTGIPNVEVLNEPSSLIRIFNKVGYAISSAKAIAKDIKVIGFTDVLEELRRFKQLNLREK